MNEEGLTMKINRAERERIKKSIFELLSKLDGLHRQSVLMTEVFFAENLRAFKKCETKGGK